MTPIFLQRFDRKTETLSIDVLVAFCSRAELDVRALADEIEEEIGRALAPDELLVLVRDTSFNEAVGAIRSSTQGKALMERLAGRCRVDVLAYDAAGRENRRETLSPGGVASDVELDEIFRRGATSIFSRRGGFVKASKSYHFANPSGAHTDRFMRLSNILVRQAEIAFIAVAVMRYVPADARQIYIDTPSLYAIVSAVNEQWRTLAPDRETLVADNFSSYFGFEEHRFTDVDGSVAIISASSSGSLARKLVERKSFDPKRIIHVLYLGPARPASQVAVDLGRDPELNPEGFSTERRTFQAEDCVLCREDSTPITLKGDQFDIAGPQHPPLMIKKADAPKTLAGAMKRLAGTGALRVAVGQRPFDIDTVELLKADDYKERLDYLLRRQVPAKVEAVVLVDPAASAVIERASEVIGSLPNSIERAAVPFMLKDRETPFSGAILVVASVIGSGRLLLDVSRDLRNVAPDAPIVYLVGFAKVADQEHKKVFNNSLVQTDKAVQHIVEYADELLLPSGLVPNPWEEELSFLERNRSAWTSGAEALLEARLERLRQTSEPLTRGLFLPDSEGNDLPLREGFVFWPSQLPKKNTHSQADVFYTICSVLQQLRTAGPSAGNQAIRANWMQQTILSPENFGRFNDGIIQASLLRAARPAELDYRDNSEASSAAAGLIRRIVESASRARGEAAAEFLLAIGTSRLRLCPKDRDAVLSELDGAPDLVAALRAMCIAESQRGTGAVRPARRSSSRQRASAKAGGN